MDIFAEPSVIPHAVADDFRVDNNPGPSSSRTFDEHDYRDQEILKDVAPSIDPSSGRFLGDSLRPIAN
ncbi:hypothetical protein CPB84DRAFT_1786119, partial [Gymnopilus junonius]